MHRVADQIQAALGIPLLDIADVTAVALKGAGVTRPGLPATGYTMEQSFYRERLTRHGFDVVVPETDDRATVHRVIYDELCQGIVRDDSRQAYREVIARLAERGADGVILGCTEIELLIGAADSPIPVFPTTQLHADAAVALALAGTSTDVSTEV